MLVFLLCAVSAVVFFLVHLIPGDPVMSILGEGAGTEDVQRLRNELNLDKSLWHQYLDFNKNLMNLSFGKSLFTNKPVIRDILVYFPNTLYLTGAAMIMALLISFPMGTLAAFKENTPVDSFVTFAGSAGMAIPNFFLGPLLIFLFSVKMGLLPVSGSDGIKYIILPAFTLGTSMSAFLTRIVRVSIGMELKKNYVVLARARGLSEIKLFFNHILKNSMIPVITTVGLQLGALLTGAIVTETIFSWQGIGTLLITSVNRRDYPMLQGLIVFITFIYLLINFFVDLSYFFLDPRIKHELKNK